MLVTEKSFVVNWDNFQNGKIAIQKNICIYSINNNKKALSLFLLRVCMLKAINYGYIHLSVCYFLVWYWGPETVHLNCTQTIDASKGRMYTISVAAHITISTNIRIVIYSNSYRVCSYTVPPVAVNPTHSCSQGHLVGQSDHAHDQTLGWSR